MLGQQVRRSLFGHTDRHADVDEQPDSADAVQHPDWADPNAYLHAGTANADRDTDADPRDRVEELARMRDNSPSLVSPATFDP